MILRNVCKWCMHFQRIWDDMNLHSKGRSMAKPQSKPQFWRSTIWATQSAIELTLNGFTLIWWNTQCTASKLSKLMSKLSMQMSKPASKPYDIFDVRSMICVHSPRWRSFVFTGETVVTHQTQLWHSNLRNIMKRRHLLQLSLLAFCVKPMLGRSNQNSLAPPIFQSRALHRARVMLTCSTSPFNPVKQCTPTCIRKSSSWLNPWKWVQHFWQRMWQHVF